MSHRRSERGELSAGCIVGVVVLFIAAIIGIRVVPAMVTVGEMQKEIDALADRANRIDYKDARIKREILEKADELHLPLDPENVDVKRTNNYIDIKVSYTLPVKFPFYTYQWNKVHEESRPLF